MKRIGIIFSILFFIGWRSRAVSIEANNSASAVVSCQVPTDYATIQAAINNNSCGLIEIAAGTFNAPVLVDRTVTIRGATRATTIIDDKITVGDAAHTSVTLTLERVTVSGSVENGILIDSDGSRLIGNDIAVTGNGNWGIDFGPTAGNSTTTLTDCDLSFNQGGVLARTLEMTNCYVHENYADGGVQINKGGFIRDSLIASNTQTFSTDDGAGVLIDTFSGTTVTIENTTIEFNQVLGQAVSNTSDGGGIMVRRGDLIVRDSIIRSNAAGRRGGGIAVHEVFAASALIEDSVISNNTAYDSGGGISVGNGTTINRARIENNTAHKATIVNANGLGHGGGIYVYDGTLAMNDTTVGQNWARGADLTGQSSGGGMYVAPFATTTVLVRRTTFSDNRADRDGGGVYVTTGTIFKNVTIAGNRANHDGGGIFGEGVGGNIQHTTIVDNSADDDNSNGGDGGGVAGELFVYHNLIGENVDKSTSGSNRPDCTGDVQSAGNSILRIGDGCTNFKQTGTDLVGDSGQPLDLMLMMPLANNGGWTQTIALDPQSIAVDAGSPTCTNTAVFDQRNATRLSQDGNNIPSDGNYCDIGAYEISDSVPVVTAISLRVVTLQKNGKLLVFMAGLATVTLLMLARRRSRLV